MHQSIKDKVAKFTAWAITPSGLRFWILALLLALCGIGSHAIGLYLEGHKLAPIFEFVGHVILSAALIKLVLKVWFWKEIENTIFERLEVRDSVVRAGISEFCWYPDVDWKTLFENSQNVTVLAISARALHEGSHVGLVRAFLKKANSSLTVIFQDPEDEATMQMLDKQFGEAAGTRVTKIRSSIAELRKLANESGVLGSIEIKLTSTRPVHSCYRFDKVGLFVPYLLEPIRAPERIPVLFFQDGQFMEKYLGRDLDYLVGNCKDAP